jgi:hypothetical protein
MRILVVLLRGEYALKEWVRCPALSADLELAPLIRCGQRYEHEARRKNRSKIRNK